MAVEPGTEEERHLDALADWLSCAVAGARERGPAAAGAAAEAAGGGPVDTAAWLGACGHVLDFDDTYEPGLAHLSAPVAPAAIALATSLDRSIGEAIEAYKRGFESLGGLTAA